jgi:hypothetical protein
MLEGQRTAPAASLPLPLVMSLLLLPLRDCVSLVAALSFVHLIVRSLNRRTLESGTRAVHTERARGMRSPQPADPIPDDRWLHPERVRLPYAP